MIKVDNKRPMGHITSNSNLVVLLYFRSQNHKDSVKNMLKWQKFQNEGKLI